MKRRRIIPTMTRSAPTTATAAVAVTLGVGTLGRQLGLAPMPPGLVQIFGPVAEASGKFVADSVRRGLFVVLVLLCPIWAGATIGDVSPVPLFEEHFEVPLAGFTFFAGAVATLWAARDYGAGTALTAVRRYGGRLRDRTARWVARAAAVIKPGRGARAARLDAWGRVYNSA